MLRALLVFTTFALFACGSDTPVPEYPFPRQTPLEETDLAQYVMDEDPLEPEGEDEEWDDGLSDEDLQMNPSEETEEAPEGEQAEPEAEEGDG